MLLGAHLVHLLLPVCLIMQHTCQHHLSSFIVGRFPTKIGYGRVGRFLWAISLVYFFAFLPAIQAQHCGRPGFMPEWNQTLLSWETSTVSITDNIDEQAGRIRTSQCDGPLCRSQNQDPLTSGTSAVLKSLNLPWRCNAFLTTTDDYDFNYRRYAFLRITISNPFPDSLLKPPRFA
jgi:hypothetical protein